jgi:hypothetical protein
MFVLSNQSLQTHIPKCMWKEEEEEKKTKQITNQRKKNKDTRATGNKCSHMTRQTHSLVQKTLCFDYAMS